MEARLILDGELSANGGIDAFGTASLCVDRTPKGASFGEKLAIAGAEDLGVTLEGDPSGTADPGFKSPSLCSRRTSTRWTT